MRARAPGRVPHVLSTPGPVCTTHTRTSYLRSTGTLRNNCLFPAERPDSRPCSCILCGCQRACTPSCATFRFCRDHQHHHHRPSLNLVVAIFIALSCQLKFEHRATNAASVRMFEVTGLATLPSRNHPQLPPRPPVVGPRVEKKTQCTSPAAVSSLQTSPCPCSGRSRSASSDCGKIPKNVRAE